VAALWTHLVSRGEKELSGLIQNWSTVFWEQQLGSLLHHVVMHDNSRFAEVRKKATAKRAELNAKTAERKTKEARELAEAAAERLEKEPPRKDRNETS
jgi:hypothetical protein